MNFDLDEQQELLADSLSRLFDAHVANYPDDYDRIWGDYRDMGLLGLPFAEAHGGLAGRPEDMMILMEAYGRTLARAPYLQSVLLAGQLLARVEGAYAAELLSSLVTGARRFTLCLTEPGSRYRWDAPSTRAVAVDNGWTISGEKSAVLDTQAETWLICPAMTDDGLGMFVIPPGAPGLTLETRSTPDGRTASDIRMDDVRLDATAALGDPAGNHAILLEVTDRAIAAICSEAVGAMERLLELTVDYLATRQQFGVAIGSFQALQHRAADMMMEVEQARSITIHAVSMLDMPARERSVAVSSAKALINRAARFVGQQAIQLHGGMGLTSEYSAGGYFQRLTVLEALLGDSDHHLAVIERIGNPAA